MFWADRIVQEAQGRPKRGGKDAPFVIRDEKTMSGRVHIGSMRGVAIHGLVSEVLKEKEEDSRYLYEFNDFDDFDAVPGYLDATVYEPHLGKPLFKVPSPEAGYDNYAEYFAAEFAEVHTKAGFTPEYYRAYKDLYATGRMDTYIRTALEKAPDVCRIYKEVSGSVKKEGWLPITVVCEKCEKLRTTIVSDFDGETVAYRCGAEGNGVVACGHEGRIAPWKGNAKLHWKVDWAAKWGAVGVDIEGGGKDHSTKGGSRDVANHIAREVFGYEPPLDIPYEFFLVGGKKMSSSKGRGSSAKDMSDLFPPALLRLVLIGKDISQQIDVDPSGDSIPRMYDWYDELAENVRQGGDDDFARMYVLSQPPKDQASPPVLWQMRFLEVAFVVQMPHLSLPEEATRIKGASLSDEELVALEERASYARFWLSTYAPERYVYKLQETLPEVSLSDAQKRALESLHSFMSEGAKTGEELHAKLHELKSEVPIEPKKLFQALYRIFLARDSGPKAGWFLSVLPHDFVLKRLEEATH